MKKLSLLKKLILVAGICIPNFLFAQTVSKPNWQNGDLKTDAVFGISIEKTYNELLKNKKHVPVLVAVIDGGVDIEHEDLKPVIWTNPGDPTADPTKAWPEDRRKVEVGTLVVKQIEPEPDGACRDLNFDPTVLPAGIRTSDDPFPAARSAAYSVSYNGRTAEEKDYPRTTAGAKP